MRQSAWILPLVIATAGAMTWVKYGSPVPWRHADPVKARHGQVFALNADAQIKQLIKNNLSDIMDCYNERLQHGLHKGGDLKISWEIDSRGTPSHFSEMKNDLNDSELFDCSAEAISQWGFPSGQPFLVHYTFHLKQKPTLADLAGVDRAVASSESNPLLHQPEQNPDEANSPSHFAAP